MGFFRMLLLTVAVLLGEIQNCSSQRPAALLQCDVDTCPDFFKDNVADNADWVVRSGHGYNSTEALYLSRRGTGGSSTRGRLLSTFLSHNAFLCVRFYCNANAGSSRNGIRVHSGTTSASGVINVMIHRGAKFYPQDEKDRPSAVCNSATWELHQMTISAHVTGQDRPSRYQVILEGRVADSADVVMGLDNIAVFAGPCRDDGTTTPAIEAATTRKASSPVTSHPATTTRVTATTSPSTAKPSSAPPQTEETTQAPLTAKPTAATPATTAPSTATLPTSSETTRASQATVITQAATTSLRPTEETAAQTVTATPSSTPTSTSSQAASPSRTLSTSSETTEDAARTKMTQRTSRRTEKETVTAAENSVNTNPTMTAAPQTTPPATSEGTRAWETKMMTQTTASQAEEATENANATSAPQDVSSSVAPLTKAIMETTSLPAGTASPRAEETSELTDTTTATTTPAPTSPSRNTQPHPSVTIHTTQRKITPSTASTTRTAPTTTAAAQPTTERTPPATPIPQTAVSPAATQSPSPPPPPTTTTVQAPSSTEQSPTNSTAIAPTTSQPETSETVTTSSSSTAQARSGTSPAKIPASVRTTPRRLATTPGRTRSTVTASAPPEKTTGITTTTATATAVNTASLPTSNSTRTPTEEKTTTPTASSSTARHSASSGTDGTPPPSVTTKPGLPATMQPTTSSTTTTLSLSTNTTLVKITQTPPSPPSLPSATLTTHAGSGSAKVTSATTRRPMTTELTNFTASASAPLEHTASGFLSTVSHIATQKSPNATESAKTTSPFPPTGSATPSQSRASVNTTVVGLVKFESTGVTDGAGTPRLATSGDFPGQRSPNDTGAESSPDTEKEAYIIATAVLGVLLFLALTLASLLLCCLRQGKKRKKKRRAHPTLDEETVMTYEMTGAQNARGLVEMSEDAGSLEFPPPGQPSVYTNLPWSTPGSRTIPAIVVSDHNNDNEDRKLSDDDDDDDSDTGDSYTGVGRPGPRHTLRAPESHGGGGFDPTYSEIASYPAAQPPNRRPQGASAEPPVSLAGHGQHVPLHRLSYPSQAHVPLSPPGSPRTDRPHERSAFTAVISISGSAVSSKTTTTSSPRSSGRDFHPENHLGTLASSGDQPRSRDRRPSAGHPSPSIPAIHASAAPPAAHNSTSRNNSVPGEQHTRERRPSGNDVPRGQLTSGTPNRDHRQPSSKSEERIYSTVFKDRGSALRQPSGIPGGLPSSSTEKKEGIRPLSSSPVAGNSSPVAGHSGKVRGPLQRQPRASRSSPPPTSTTQGSPNTQHPAREIPTTSASGQHGDWGRQRGQRERGEGHDTGSGRDPPGRDGAGGGGGGGGGRRASEDESGPRRQSGVTAIDGAGTLRAEHDERGGTLPLSPRERLGRPGYSPNPASRVREDVAAAGGEERTQPGTGDDHAQRSPASASVQYGRDLTRAARNPFLNSDQAWSSKASGGARGDLTKRDENRVPRSTAGQLRSVNWRLHRTEAQPPPPAKSYPSNCDDSAKNFTPPSTRLGKDQHGATAAAASAAGKPVSAAGKNPFVDCAEERHHRPVGNDRRRGDGAAHPDDDVHGNIAGCCDDDAGDTVASPPGAPGESNAFSGSRVKDQRENAKLPSALRDVSRIRDTTNCPDTSLSAVRQAHLDAGDGNQTARLSRPAVPGSATVTPRDDPSASRAPTQTRNKAASSGNLSGSRTENHDEQSLRRGHDPAVLPSTNNPGAVTLSRHDRHTNDYGAVISANVENNPFIGVTGLLTAADETKAVVSANVESNPFIGVNGLTAADETKAVVSANVESNPFIDVTGLTAADKTKPPSPREAPPGRSSPGRSSTPSRENGIHADGNKLQPPQPQGRSDIRGSVNSGSSTSSRTLTESLTDQAMSHSGLQTSSVTSRPQELLIEAADFRHEGSPYNAASRDGEDAANVLTDEFGLLQVSDV